MPCVADGRPPHPKTIADPPPNHTRAGIRCRDRAVCNAEESPGQALPVFIFTTTHSPCPPPSMPCVAGGSPPPPPKQLMPLKNNGTGAQAAGHVWVVTSASQQETRGPSPLAWMPCVADGRPSPPPHTHSHQGVGTGPCVVLKITPIRTSLRLFSALRTVPLSTP